MPSRDTIAFLAAAENFGRGLAAEAGIKPDLVDRVLAGAGSVMWGPRRRVLDRSAVAILSGVAMMRDGLAANDAGRTAQGGIAIATAMADLLATAAKTDRVALVDRARKVKAMQSKGGTATRDAHRALMAPIYAARNKRAREMLAKNPTLSRHHAGELIAEGETAAGRAVTDRAVRDNLDRSIPFRKRKSAKR